MSGYEISELKDLEDLRTLERTLAEIWGRPDEPPLDSDVLMALVHSGNYVAGVRIGGRLYGGLVGWLGGMPPDRLILHSHILGVTADIPMRGLGFALKQHQRAWCLARGVKTMEWTFDPLVRRNAYFNLNKLGAEADEYLVNFYGAMSDGINAGEESDRILVTWRLDSARAQNAAAGRPTDVGPGDDLDALLTVAPSGEPVQRSSTADRVTAEVPEDIVAMRRTDADLARAWRMALRSAFTQAFAAGYHITGVTRTGRYLLAHR